MSWDRRQRPEKERTGTCGASAGAWCFWGVLMPALVTVENTGIYRTLMNGIYQGQEIYVLLAALKLVLLNAVRAYPHYMGVFFWWRPSGAWS